MTTNRNTVEMDLNHIKISTESENSLKNGASEIVSLIRPDWGSKTTFIHKIFSDGLTNKLVGVYTQGQKTKMVLVRVYGLNSDLMIDRKKEIQNMKLLHKHNCGSELYAIFENGIAYEYLSGTPLTVDSVRDPSVFPKVATAIAKMHSIKPPGRIEPCIWKLLRKFQKLSPEGFPDDPERDAYFKKAIPFTKSELAIEIDKMEELLGGKDILSKSRIVFSHNDLMPTNIIGGLEGCNRKDAMKVSMIDYEYGDWNYREFDLANHFGEFVGLPDQETGKLNYDKYYPSKDLQLKWLAEYLKDAKKFETGREKNASEKEIEELHGMIKRFNPLPHLLWGIWSLIQSKYSDIDFDYIDYGMQRLVQYIEHSQNMI